MFAIRWDLVQICSLITVAMTLPIPEQRRNGRAAGYIGRMVWLSLDAKLGVGACRDIRGNLYRTGHDRPLAIGVFVRFVRFVRRKARHVQAVQHSQGRRSLATVVTDFFL